MLGIYRPTVSVCVEYRILLKNELSDAVCNGENALLHREPKLWGNYRHMSDLEKL